ncbi:MAG: phosphoribosyl-ATP diphosphatase [Pseudomonadota bacterium]
MSETIGQALDQLFLTIASKRGKDIGKSYSATLLNAGPKKCAKKFGEEAVELAIAIAAENKVEIAEEAADLLFHFAAAIIASGVDANEVSRVLAKRRGIGGLEEKASRPK